MLRLLQPAQINRATLIAAAQLTEEMDRMRVPINGKGLQTQWHTFSQELARHQPAPPVFHALQTVGTNDSTVGPARAKKAVACLLWMGGVPIADIERCVMAHYPGNDAAGAVRATTGRMLDVISTVIEMARLILPAATLDDLARLLPVQLEHGVPPAAVPLAAQAGTALGRADYLRLVAQGLIEPARIAEAAEETLLACVGGSPTRLDALRVAVTRLVDTGEEPDFAALLAASVD